MYHLPEDAQILSESSAADPVGKDPIVAMPGEDHRLRDARRLIRAVKNQAYDLIRTEKRAQRITKESEPMIKIFVTLADQVGMKHLAHRVGRREAYECQKGAWHKIRKKLIRKFRLKGLHWNLWERDNVAWVCLPKAPQVNDGA
jgi:hypothetical protein